MPIKFLCPQCQKKIRVADAHAGKRGVCPACKQAIEIPAASTLPDNDARVVVASESTAAPGVEVNAKPEPLAPAEVPTEVPAAVAETPVEKSAAPSASAAYLKFNCPGCGKMTGFPQDMAGKPAACPACKVKLMVPEQQGGESFIIGTAAAAPRPRPVSEPLPVPPAAAPAGLSPKTLVIAVVGTMAAAVVLTLVVINLTRGADAKVAAAQNTQTQTAPPAEKPVVPPPVKSDNHETRKDKPAETVLMQANSTEATKPPVVVPAANTEIKPDTQTQKEVSPFGDSKSPEQTVVAPPPSQPEVPLVIDRKKQDDLVDDIDPNEGKMTPKKEPAKDELKNLAVKPEDPKPPEPVKPVAPAQPAMPAVCQDCLGTGFLPLAGIKPYVRHGADNPPDPAQIVPWGFCSKCRKGEDSKELVAAEKTRLEGAEGKHQMWETLTGLKLLYTETRHVSMNTQLPPAMAKNVGNVCEKLTAHLESLTRTTLLTQTRPDSHVLLIMWDSDGFGKLIDAFEKQSPGDHWALARKSVGGMGRNMGYFNARGGAQSGPEHMATFQFAKMLIMEATNGKARPWLTEGFAAYCENAMLQKNLCYSFSYEANEVKFGANWDQDIKKYAQQSKLKTWDTIFPLELIGIKSLDYLTCYSMVSYMIKTDPKRFAQLVSNIREGLDSAKALEKAYSRPVKDIQNMWGQWTLR